MQSPGRIRGDNRAGDDSDDEGVVPFVAVRALSTTPVAIAGRFKSEPRGVCGGDSVQAFGSNGNGTMTPDVAASSSVGGVKGMREPGDVAHRSGACGEGHGGSGSDKKGIFLSLTDKRYKEKITAASEVFWGRRTGQEDGANCKKILAQKIFDELKDELKPGEHLYRGSLGRNSCHRATRKESLKKIRNDIGYRYETSTLTGKGSSGADMDSSNSNGDVKDGVRDGSDKAICKSPKKKKRNKRDRSTIKYSPREYMAGYIESILPRHGWTVRRDGLDRPLALRKGSDEKNGVEGIAKFTGYDSILDEAYRCGLYEEHVVGGVEGSGFLAKAGILEDPYSIFTEDLLRERKRLKQRQGITKPTQGESINQPRKMNAKRENHVDGPSPSSLGGSAAHGNAHELGTQASFRAAPDLDAIEAEQETENKVPDPTLGIIPGQTNKPAAELDSEGVTAQAPTSMAYENKNESVEIPSTKNLTLEAKSAASSPTYGDINESETPANDQDVLFSSARAEQVPESFVAANPPPHPKNETTASTAFGRIKQSIQVYEFIKSKLLASGNKTQQQSNLKEKIATLQNVFYSHLKSWLAPRVSKVLEHDLNKIQDILNEFESTIKKLEISCNEEDVLCYTSGCEGFIEVCKEQFPL